MLYQDQQNNFQQNIFHFTLPGNPDKTKPALFSYMIIFLQAAFLKAISFIT